MVNYFEIKDGKIYYTNEQKRNEWISQQRDGKYVEDLKKYSEKRTNKMNKVWWLYMSIISDHTGYTKEESNEICKMQLLKRTKVDENTGHVFDYLKSFSECDIPEGLDIIKQLQVWSAQTLDCILPDPDPNYQFKLKTN